MEIKLQLQLQDIIFVEKIMSSWIVYKWEFVDFYNILDRIIRNSINYGRICLPSSLKNEINYKKVFQEKYKKIKINTNYFYIPKKIKLNIVDIQKEPLIGKRTAGILFVDNSFNPPKILLCQELSQSLKNSNLGFSSGNVISTPTMWSIPKGRVEDGESVLVSAIKESIEEVGIFINPIFLQTQNLYKISYKNSLWYYYICNISSTLFSEEKLYPLHIGSEIHRVQWFDNFKNLQINKYSKKIILFYLDNKK